MKKLYILLSLIGVLCLGYACTEKPITYPTPTDLSTLNVGLISGPGYIVLTWDADDNMLFVKTCYTISDPLDYFSGDRVKLTSNKSFPFPTEEEDLAEMREKYPDIPVEVYQKPYVIIDDLRARYGEITFSMQSFNDNNTPGNLFEIKGSSGIMPITEEISHDNIALSVDAIYPNAMESAEGNDLSVLFNGTIATTDFFHSSWTGECVDKTGATFSNPGMPHYLVFDLGEEYSSCEVTITARQIGNDAPGQVAFYGTQNFDYDNHWTAANFDNTYGPESEEPFQALTEKFNPEWSSTSNPADFTANVSGDNFRFRYLWFAVYSGKGGGTFFALSEVAISATAGYTYNPETEEKVFY